MVSQVSPNALGAPGLQAKPPVARVEEISGFPSRSGPASPDARAETRELQARAADARAAEGRVTEVRTIDDRALEVRQDRIDTRAASPDQRPSLRDLLPSDPNAPAGPPPAFEASILDRAREQAASPPPIVPEIPRVLETGAPDFGPEPVETSRTARGETAREAAPGETPERAEAEEPTPPAPNARPYDVPPSAEVRAETEVASLRRIETPYDTATVDVTR